MTENEMTENELEQIKEYFEVSHAVISDLRKKLAEVSELVSEDKLKELHKKWGFKSSSVQNS